jgi:hypothetical protein
MDQEPRPDPAPRGVSTLDFLLLTAGFACGWVMYQRSALCVSQDHDLPLSTETLPSFLGAHWYGWLWAFVTGVAFLIVVRPFRFDCGKRPAEWLAVALTLVLLESVYYKPVGTSRSLSVVMDFERRAPRGVYTVNVLLDGRSYPTTLTYDFPLTFEFKLPQRAHAWKSIWWVSPPTLTAAAVVYALVWSRIRTRASAGWKTFFAVTIAVLAVLGPMRLAESDSADFLGFPYDGETGPFLKSRPWRWTWLPVRLDLRAWAGYTPRALALMTLAFLATGSLLKRWRHWLWTEWAAFIPALVIAGCWVYNELVVRPALDQTARVVFLCTWILAIAVMAAGGICIWSRLGRRFRSTDGRGRSC